nr:type I secretion system permease/ATPase [Proteus sp. G4379]
MNYITENTPSLHPSIIDGLIYFSKKNKGTLKKEQLIHFLGNDDNLSELNIIEAAQQLNLKCEFSFFNSESEYKDKIIIDTLIEINGYWYILKNRISDKLIIIDPSTNTESHYHIDKKITYTTLLIINKIFTPKQSKFSLMWCIPSLLKQKKS